MESENKIHTAVQSKLTDAQKSILSGKYFSFWAENDSNVLFLINFPKGTPEGWIEFYSSTVTI